MTLIERINALATRIGTEVKSVKTSLNGKLPYSGANSDIDFGINNFVVDTNTFKVDKVNHRVGIKTLTPTYSVDVRGFSDNDGIRSAMGFDVYQVPDPTAPTGVVSAGGSVNIGNHQYFVVYVTAVGETHSSPTSSNIATTSGNQTVTLTIPVSTDNRVIARKIYRNTIAVGWSFQLLATVNDNTTATYVDTTSDAGLGAYRSSEKANTTAKLLTVNGVNSITIDKYSTYLGYLAGNVNEGTNNTFIGVEVGKVNTTGSSNTAIGRSALIANIGGNYNFAGGFEALKSNTSGEYNTAIGMRALASHTTGWHNTAIGYASLYRITTGTFNIGVGGSAGEYRSDGSTANTASAQSIFIGYGTRSLASDTNAIVVGYNAISKGTNRAVWGNTSITHHYFSGQLIHNPISSAPSSPEEGAIYYNSTDKHFYGYNGTTWKQLDN